MDTLWKNVDLRSVESFIQFGRAIDPTFSYLDPATFYSHNEYNRRLVRSGKTKQKYKDCNEGNSEQENEESNEEDEAEGVLKPPFTSTFQSTQFLPLSTAVPSESSTSALSLDSMSTLRWSSTPGHVGYAGKDFIRVLSIAGTNGCQSPRPFPYLPSCITDRHLVAISSSLTHLTSLSLCHCTAITDMAVIQLITASSPYLKQIDLTECRLITNLTVQVIAQLCSQLEDLSLKKCSKVTDDALEELARHCTRLQRIDIGQCRRVSDRALMALLGASGRMTQHGATTKTGTMNARLLKLDIAGCRGITSKGLMAISNQLTCSSIIGQDEAGDRHSSLASLGFTCPTSKQQLLKISTGSANSATIITRAVSQASRFFETLPTTLEEIAIQDAYLLNKDDVICLVDRIGISLECLRLDNANAVNSETLTHILKVCPNLTILAIPGATQLDDAGVMQLTTARCASSLMELDLRSCHALTDASLMHLVKGSNIRHESILPFDIKGKGVEERTSCIFPNLRRLDLSYNDKLTLAGIAPLAKSLKNLCALDVSFCGDGVTRIWSRSLESPRFSLTSTSATSHSRQQDDETRNGLSASSSHSQNEVPWHNSSVSSVNVANRQIHSPQSIQDPYNHFNGNSAVVNPNRRALGRYVGPMLNRQGAAERGGDSTAVETQHHYTRRRSSASSMSSSCSTNTTSSSLSVISTSSSSSSSSTSLTLSYPPLADYDDPSSLKEAIPLADRLDILDNTPCGMGVQASFHQGSWFTAQHQFQLQKMFQLQLQHQRESQDQLAAIVATGNGAGTGGAMAIAQTGESRFLSDEMMVHPVMMASRAGAATIGTTGGSNANRTGDLLDMSVRMSRQLRIDTNGGYIGAGRNGARHHHRYTQHSRDQQQPQGSVASSGISGHCEISAWGLANLREEWDLFKKPLESSAMAVLKLFCLVDGDYKSYSVKVPADDAVNEFKEPTKIEKAVEFGDVDADRLTLWRVSVPITDDDEVPSCSML
ncbi:hypothetical protein BG011_000257 [Mortierella polycephala]|uniref:RNI-like protein n=1 Tax=Mortierella polycephala TaxID=41804 RepID=A0A9P6PM79_9FUNG|nr:hypothetical protein BG011_000257 [Mortierella polycephala]